MRGKSHDISWVVKNMVENIIAIVGVLGGASTAYFAFRGKREDTDQSHDKTISDALKVQTDLVKNFRNDVENMRAENKKLQEEISLANKKMQQMQDENKRLRIQLKETNAKLDELIGQKEN